MARVVLVAVMDNHGLQVILRTDAGIPKQVEIHMIMYFPDMLAPSIKRKTFSGVATTRAVDSQS